MLLNLHILREDLARYSLKGRLNVPPTTFNLSRPVLCHTLPDAPQPDVLYIVHAEQLPEQVIAKPRLSIACVGLPSDAWRNSIHDVLWSKLDIDLTDLVNDLIELFQRYNDWDLQLREAAYQENPFEYVAEITQPLLPNPFAVLTTSFRLLFTSFPEPDNPSEEFLEYKRWNGPTESGFMKTGDIVSVVADDQHQLVESATVPVLFNGTNFKYITLIYNIYVEGTHYGYLTSDDVLKAHTLREHALFKFLGDIIGRLFAQRDTYLLMHPDIVKDAVSNLLKHKRVVPEQDIIQTLAYFDIAEDDTFVCVTMTLKDRREQMAALDALAINIARLMTNGCYYVMEDEVVFVFDLTNREQSRAELLGQISYLCDSLFLTAGVSPVFRDFRNMYYYYYQAHYAMTMGIEKDPKRPVHSFEENAIEFAMAKLARNTIVETFIPTELVQLMRHDEEHDSNYVHLLKVYLRNERNIARTIREEFIHRNTFNYRLERIKEILDVDLDDPDVRFQLLLAFYMLEHNE